jgi:hypothetical protein
MFGKFNIKVLVIVFGALLIGVVILYWIQNKGEERNFRSNLAEIDTSKITAIILKPAKKPYQLRLEKQGNSWKVKLNNKSYLVNKSSVDAILSGLTQLRTERLVSSSLESRNEYDVSDSLGTRVTVEGNGKTLVDMVVRKFNYQQSNQSVTTYARLYNEDDIYAINGYLSMNFNQDINSLRYNALGKGTATDISKLTFSYPADSSFTLAVSGGKWNLDGSSVDSTKLMNYLQLLTTATGTKFADDNVNPGNLLYSLKVAESGKNNFEIQAFAGDSVNRFYLTSTANPGAKFFESGDGLIAKIFTGKKFFLLGVKK